MEGLAYMSRLSLRWRTFSSRLLASQPQRSDRQLRCNGDPICPVASNAFKFKRSVQKHAPSTGMFSGNPAAILGPL